MIFSLSFLGKTVRIQPATSLLFVISRPADDATAVRRYDEKCYATHATTSFVLLKSIFHHNSKLARVHVQRSISHTSRYNSTQYSNTLCRIVDR